MDYASPPANPSVSSGPWFVILTNPQCLRCVPRLAEFQKASVLLTSLVQFGHVQCSESYLQSNHLLEEDRGLLSGNAQSSLCKRFQNTAKFPHFLWFPKGLAGQDEEYVGVALGSALADFGTSFLPHTTNLLTTYEEYIAAVLEATHPVFAVYAMATGSYHYAELIATELKKLSLLLKPDNVEAVFINCDQEALTTKACAYVGFHGYPRLFLFHGASRRDVGKTEFLGDWFAHEIAEWIRSTISKRTR